MNRQWIFMFISLLLVSTAYAVSQIPNKFKDGDRARAEDINENFESLHGAIAELEAKVQKMGQQLSAGNKVQSELRSLKTRIDRVLTAGGDLIVPKNRWSGGVKKVGYGSAPHIWKTKTANCPNGQYVSGVEVVYRGTCFNKCDKDGGIIGDIVLLCRSL